jgi:hypothetical protein
MMTYRRLRWPVGALLGTLSAGFLALAWTINPVCAHADDATLIMGGTGDPTPDSMYLTDVNNAYILPNIYPATDTTTALTTPEQGFPLTPGLTFDASVAQGLDDLQQAIASEPSSTDTVFPKRNDRNRLPR